MGAFLDTHTLKEQAVRPDVASDVFGRVLLDGATKVVLTRVAPGGRFASHRDPYAHLFYILEGQAKVRAGEEERTLGPGAVVRVEAGEIHGYENCGTEDLVLLSLNLP